MATRSPPAAPSAEPNTGMPSLDAVLQGLRWGDNVVWHVERIEDYLPFVEAYLAQAQREQRTIVYFRFARHAPLVARGAPVTTFTLHPEHGFESFVTEIRAIIQRVGRRAYYLFDCLSDLVADWYSDRMLGNFFMLTCPYLYQFDTITYFAVLRDSHSDHAIVPIRQTTQIAVDVFRQHQRLYIHPVKVEGRSSPTMYMLHAWEKERFVPVTQSAAIARILSPLPWSRREDEGDRRDYWARAFAQAAAVQAATQRGDPLPDDLADLTLRLLRMAVVRQGRLLALAQQVLTLDDILAIRGRMIGTGLIGGKAVGMLLARALLRRAAARWATLLEPHDSFFIGADEFYTYLVRNGLWWIKQRQKDPQRFLDGAEDAQQQMRRGSFSSEITQQFADMLDYFGQSPIVVRSSSLLEDDFGNAFAGKYESVFCPNQGSRDARLENFIRAVRTVYASTMSETALRYRADRGLLGQDEQMALLVQRVSGAFHPRYYYAQLSGVGLSFNPFVWHERIDASSGVLRLVFGLGTRAVNRSDDDYTRIVALNEPMLLPEDHGAGLGQYAQRKVDVLDLQANEQTTLDFSDVVRDDADLPLSWFVTQPRGQRHKATARLSSSTAFAGHLTFERLLRQTDFVQDMRDMLHTLQQGYAHPVDVEFTANCDAEGRYAINVVQCRPFGIKAGSGDVATLPPHPPQSSVLISRGPVLGHSRHLTLARIIYVVPAVYGQMTISERYTVARVVGEVVRATDAATTPTTLLVGPGRWGTSSPELGVPVSFAEINQVSVLCEIVTMRAGLVPDVSLGTHFFGDLVEMDMLYFAFFPDRPGNLLDATFFEQMPNHLSDLHPQRQDLIHAIRVIHPQDLPSASPLTLTANVLKQEVTIGKRGEKGGPGDLARHHAKSRMSPFSR